MMLTTPFPRFGRKPSKPVFVQLDLFPVSQVFFPEKSSRNCQTCGMENCGLTSCAEIFDTPPRPGSERGVFRARTGDAGAGESDKGEGSKGLYVPVTRKGSPEKRDYSPESGKGSPQTVDYSLKNGGKGSSDNRDKTPYTLLSRGYFLTWTGRGKRPAWVDDWIAKGGTLEQLRDGAIC